MIMGPDNIFTSQNSSFDINDEKVFASYVIVEKGKDIYVEAKSNNEPAQKMEEDLVDYTEIIEELEEKNHVLNRGE